jgi:putative ABC transport system permease protein
VRFADILGLALGALARQKVRTLLTTLGVVFGTFVLVASVATGVGAQAAILREFSRHSDLRQIDVFAGDRKAEPPPAEQLEVRGVMSDARRGRIRKELTRRWEQEQVAIPAVPLDRAALDRIAALPHVRSAVPLGLNYGRVVLGGRSWAAQFTAATPQVEGLSDRVVAGTVYPSADSRSVLVGEMLLYELGVEDDAAVERFLNGGTIRFEVNTGEGPPPGFFLKYLNPFAAAADTVREEMLLDLVVKRLPEAIEKLDLSEAERAGLKELMAKPAAKARRPKPAGEPVIAAEFPVCGVIRAADDQKVRYRDWALARADLVLPPRLAEEFYFRLPTVREYGLDHIVVEVDAIEHVRDVSKAIRETGLQAESMVERMDVDQFVYLMMFAAMSSIAAVSLLVACLGITNTMLMSVLERVREIGVMKAVGARDAHVQAIFLVEGALIGLVGGLVGLLLGWLVKFPADAWLRSLLAERTKIQLEASVFMYPWWLVVGAPAFAVVVTTLAAVYPARRAARVDPVTALRHE